MLAQSTQFFCLAEIENKKSNLKPSLWSWKVSEKSNHTEYKLMRTLGVGTG